MWKRFHMNDNMNYNDFDYTTKNNTVLYILPDYWDSGPCPLPNIRNKHAVLETGSVSTVMWKGERHLLRSVCWIVLSQVQWLGLAIFNGPKWVGASLPFHLRMEIDAVSKTFCPFKILCNRQSLKKNQQSPK
jgi:hypothetical protein